MPFRHLSWIAMACAAACASSPHDVPPITSLPMFPAEVFADDEEALTPEELQADLTALYEGLQEAHYDLYARQSKAAYDALYARLFDDLDEPLRPSEAVFIFQRFAAFGNIAHARVEGSLAVWGRYREAGGKALPIYPRVRGDRMFVADSYAPGVAAGEEILAIDGRETAYWLQRLYRNTSGDNDYLRSTLLELAFPVDLWAELGAIESAQLILQDEAGTRRTVTVETVDRETLSDRIDNNEADYFTLDAVGRKASMLEGGIAYLQPGPFYGVETPEMPWDPSAFWSYIDESFTMFLEEDAQALIIDMRQNPGGDNSFSDHMIAWFADEPFRFASEFLVRSSPQSEASNQARIDANPAMADGVSGLFSKGYAETPYGETFPFEIPFSQPRDGVRFEGPVYVLVDRYSYSNTVSVAALVQDYGFATVLGEETADLPTTYGAMETFVLPHSGLVVGYPKAFIVRPSGERTDGGVVPDVLIEAPVFSADDVMLEKTITIIRQEIVVQEDH